MSRTLFIHIPKTGGTSINESGLVTTTSYKGLKPDIKKQMDIDPVGPHSFGPIFSSMVQKHLPFSYLSQEHLNRFNRVFAVVRNPWSRLVSFYNYADIMRETYKGDKKFIESKITWEEYLSRIEKFTMTPNFYWQHPYNNWGSQSDYVSYNKVDFLRQEYLQEDLSKYLGKDVDLPIVKPSLKVDYRTYYTEEQKQKVAEWYRVDINHWGFDFDTPATKNCWALR